MPEQSAPTTPIGTVARKILIVDDNCDAANSLREVLEMLGCVARVAYDGPTALRVADAFRPHLAFLDIGLPSMDGYELAVRIRSAMSGAAPRLVALTGYGQIADSRRAAEAGFDDHLIKPVDFDRLQDVIAQTLPAG